MASDQSSAIEIKVGILTEDASGPNLKSLTTTLLNNGVIAKHAVVPDDVDRIKATKLVIEREAPGLMVAMLKASLDECFRFVLPALPHAVNLLRGDVQQVATTHRLVQGETSTLRSEASGPRESKRTYVHRTSHSQTVHQNPHQLTKSLSGHFEPPKSPRHVMNQSELLQKRQRDSSIGKDDVNDIKRPRTGAERSVFAVPVWGGSKHLHQASGSRVDKSNTHSNVQKDLNETQSHSNKAQHNIRPSNTQNIPDNSSIFINQVCDNANAVNQSPPTRLKDSTETSSVKTSHISSERTADIDSSSKKTESYKDKCPSTPYTPFTDADYICTYTPLDLLQHHDDTDVDIDVAQDGNNDSVTADDVGHKLDAYIQCMSVSSVVSHYEDISDDESDNVVERSALKKDETRKSDEHIENMTNIVNQVSLMEDLNNMPVHDDHSPECVESLLDMADNAGESGQSTTEKKHEGTDVVDDHDRKTDEEHDKENSKATRARKNKAWKQKYKIAKNMKDKSNAQAKKQHCKDGMVCFAQVGKNAKLWTKEHPLIRDIYLNKGKRETKKSLVEMKRQNSAKNIDSYIRKGIVNERNRIDDYFEFTEEGRAKRQLLEEYEAKDEYVVSWYMWCPGHGNCLRRCGGYGKCVPGCPGSRHKQDRHNCSFLLCWKLYLSDLDQWRIKLSGSHVPVDSGVTWVPPHKTRVRMDEDTCDAILKYSEKESSGVDIQKAIAATESSSARTIPSKVKISRFLTHHKKKVLQKERESQALLDSMATDIPSVSSSLMSPYSYGELLSVSSGEPHSVMSMEPSSVSSYDPHSVSSGEPQSVDYSEPPSVEISEPPSVAINEPMSVAYSDIQEPASNYSYYSDLSSISDPPSAYSEPPSVCFTEPPSVYYAPSSIDSQAPLSVGTNEYGPLSVGYSEPPSVCYSEPPSVDTYDPPDVNSDVNITINEDPYANTSNTSQERNLTQNTIQQVFNQQTNILNIVDSPMNNQIGIIPQSASIPFVGTSVGMMSLPLSQVAPTVSCAGTQLQFVQQIAAPSGGMQNTEGWDEII
ncbi:hypothetical protein MAR_001419 [Mya arenaria]|uniref:Uncharacterized protein n=1 Tax=Mya arenaria TaxID=6604 RepID=A0ABY7FFS3_MYAAR|nr:hypothetical protein MAR_001419 [Mya arenaria]